MNWLDYVDGDRFGGECIRQRSLEDLRKELEKVRQFREGKWYEYGMDGTIEVWRRRYVYRGIPYEIAMLKYFTFNEPDPLNARGLNNLGAYCILEHVDEWKEVEELLEELELKENWLWEDTLHPGMENWPIPVMVQWLHERAKGDINFLLDEVPRRIILKLAKKMSKALRLLNLIKDKTSQDKMELKLLGEWEEEWIEK